MTMTSSGLWWWDGNSSHDLDVWKAAWESLPERRPHYHPSFVTTLCPADRHPAAVYYEGPQKSCILYPFWIGNLKDLDFCPQNLQGTCDIVSPYGYGGPSYHGPSELQGKVEGEFRKLFSAVCRERGVVSEFVREDIFNDHIVQDVGERIYRQDNVVVRLGLSEEEHLRRYKHKVRKNVRRAREAGLKVIFDEQGERLSDFLDVYYSTMERTGASSYFFFSEEVLAELVNGLGLGKGLIFVHVMDGGRVVSTELLLLSRDSLYSFLGGTLETSRAKRPNDLLKHETILWGGRSGFKHYVLGGGVEAGDGIFRFKEAFDPESILPFSTRQRIHDPTAYEELVAARASVQPPPRSDFFPRYRA